MWGAYHVHRPDHSPSSQVSRFLTVIGTQVADIPHTIDVEVSAGMAPANVTSNLMEVMSLTPAVRSKLPHIYTNAGYWNYNVHPSGAWKHYPLHVANYTTRPEPTLPRDWTAWQLWQYTDKGPGPVYGVQSACVDLNRFAGDYAAWRAACGFVEPFPPVPAPNPEVDMLEVKTALNLRTGQSTSHSVITTMPAGERVELHEVGILSGGYPWLKVRMPRTGQTGWCASVISGVARVQVVR
jgi:hypothetical protein